VGVIRRVVRSVSALAGDDSRLVRTLRPSYERLLVWSTGARGLLQTVNGRERFRIDPRHRRHFPETYEPAVAAYLREHVRPGACCLNVGAHLGIYTLCLSEWAGASGRVYAFEPNPRTRRILESHVRLNERQERVQVIGAAVSDRPGRQVFFAAADGFSGLSRLGSPNPEARIAPTYAVDVQVTTIDAFCREAGIEPDWLVIDIEGYEVGALRGAVETLRRGRPRPRVVVEMHPNLWTTAGTSRGEAEHLLRSLGRVAIPLSGQADPLADHGMVALESAR
jgi:FkbM family methyltransferase